MRVVGRNRLQDFCDRHGDAAKWVSSWLSEVEDGSWNTPHDIKRRYRSASFLADNIVIWNVKGNRYRLVCRVAYKTKIVSIFWVGTHAEYDKLEF